MQISDQVSAGHKHDKSFRLTDPRLLLQLCDPEIPVALGPHRLLGKITDFENEQYASVQVTLYHYGPPLMSFNLSAVWSWPDVHHAWATGQPLEWY